MPTGLIKLVSEFDRVQTPGPGLLNNIFVKAGEYNKLVQRVNSIASADGTLIGTIDSAALTISDTTQSTSSTTGALIVSGGVGIAKDVYIAGVLNVAKDLNLATASGVTTVGSTTAATLSAAGLLTINNATDATAYNATASVQSLGGLAIAKKLFVGTDVTLSSQSGTVTLGATTPVTVSTLGVLTVPNATDSSSSTTGGTIVSGGLGVAKKLFVGTDTNLATVSGVTTIGATTAATISTAGLLTIANATDATASNATASIATSGGLAVTKKAYIGTQLNTQSLIKRPVTTTTVAAGSLITGAMLITGYIEVTGTTNSSALDSAANITTALGTSPIGTSFDCYINTMGATPMTAGNILTVTAGANTTFMKQISSGDSASAFLATVTATAGVHSAILRITFDTATSISVQRIG